jgi:hypothetical protein
MLPLRRGMTFFFLVLFTLAATNSHASDFKQLTGNGVEVLFPPPLERAAKETAQMTPKIKKDLEEIFRWPFNFTPTILLMNDPNRFQQITHSPLVVGFAVPEKGLVVIDYGRTTNPLQFRDILKHELCHLLIHKHITHVPIPRWFDEGVAQWSSNGVMDIVHDPKDALLPKAAFSDRVIPLGALGKGFPQNPNALRLAYEESISFIDFIIANYGKSALLDILHLMKDGKPLRKAVLTVVGSPLYQIEENWRKSLKQNIAWFAHLSYYLYDILFVLGGLIVVYGFIKILRKKRAYMEED